jgi:transposase-like protein
MDTTPTLINLGLANDWATIPEIVKACTHDKEREQIGKCLTRYTCPVCHFTYTRDSGD